jgi:hypothetical protein
MIAPPRRHARRVRIGGNDGERADRGRKVEDPVVLPFGAVPDGLRRVGDSAPDASAITASTRRYSSISSSGAFSTVASTRPVLARMCGDSHSANSAASLITPRQSALGLPDVDGGEGHPLSGQSLGRRVSAGRQWQATAASRRGGGGASKHNGCQVHPILGAPGATQVAVLPFMVPAAAPGEPWSRLSWSRLRWVRTNHAAPARVSAAAT